MLLPLSARTFTYKHAKHSFNNTFISCRKGVCLEICDLCALYIPCAATSPYEFALNALSMMTTGAFHTLHNCRFKEFIYRFAHAVFPFRGSISQFAIYIHVIRWRKYYESHPLIYYDGPISWVYKRIAINIECASSMYTMNRGFMPMNKLVQWTIVQSHL